jgi:hypothetical protein
MPLFLRNKIDASPTKKCGALQASHGPDYYRAKLARFRSLSHLTIEVRQTT